MNIWRVPPLEICYFKRRKQAKCKAPGVCGEKRKRERNVCLSLLFEQWRMRTRQRRVKKTRYPKPSTWNCGKTATIFFSLPAPAVDSSQLKYFSLDLNVCATVYPHMYYTYTDRLLSLFKWLFSTCETMCCSAAGFRSAGNLPWQKVLAKHEREWRWNAYIHNVNFSSFQIRSML